MATPTKKQIERIRKNIPAFVCEFDVECIPTSEVIEKIIIEWEKIRNKKQNACTKKSCWYYCESNSDGCFLPESYQRRPTCFISHKKAKELLAD